MFNQPRRHCIGQYPCITLLLLSLVMLITACTPIGLAPVATPIPQPASPLIPGKNLTLIKNRWRLVEIIFHGENVAFAAIQPIYYTFSADGYLNKRTTGCNSGSYQIMAESEQRYRLVPHAGTAQACGALREQQYDKVTEAVAATTAYELQENQLLLTGDNIRVVLEIDNPR